MASVLRRAFALGHELGPRGATAVLYGGRHDARRHLVEVQDAGKPADVTGYR